MKAKRALLLLAGWCAGWTLTWADPAVLLKEYPAQIVRGNYVLGNRTVRVGELVTVQAIKGINAEVTTADNDRLTVLLADLRTLPEPSTVQIANPAPRIAAQPGTSPAPAVVASATSPGAPAPVVAGARLAATAIQGTAVITSGAELIAERRVVKVRCTHLTKKGTQCSRMTDSPNGLCWQHGGD